MLDANPGEPLVNCLSFAYLVEATCGGMCSCATCHVYIGPGSARPTSSAEGDERFLLDGLNCSTASSRLACQIVLTPELDGLELTVAPEL